MAKKKTEKKMPGKVPSVETPEHKKKRRSWNEQAREIDRKINDLIYEDRNGYRPPRPWYETESKGATTIPRFKEFHSVRGMWKEAVQE